MTLISRISVAPSTRSTVQPGKIKFVPTICQIWRTRTPRLLHCGRELLSTATMKQVAQKCLWWVTGEASDRGGQCRYGLPESVGQHAGLDAERKQVKSSSKIRKHCVFCITMHPGNPRNPFDVTIEAAGGSAQSDPGTARIAPSLLLKTMISCRSAWTRIRANNLCCDR